MSKKSRNFLIGITASILLVLVVALVAAGAYQFGRKSVEKSELADRDPNVVPSEPTGNSPEAGLVIEPDADENNESQRGDGKKEQNTPEFQAKDMGEESVTTIIHESLELEKDDLDLVFEVWEIIEREYDGELPSEAEISYGAIAGSLRLLDDQFTRFIPPEIAERTREQLEGSFEGIGAFVDLSEEGYLLIVRPIKGQPADLAGLQSGDIVTRVNGKDILGKSLDEIIADVKGPKGTEVTLTIIRESAPEGFDVTIVRDRIEIPIVESESLEDGIAYIRLTSFSGNAAEQLTEALENQLESEPRALIFDLRDNPGGFLSQSVEVADLFLPSGVILYQRDISGDEEIFESDDGDAAEVIPLVVLVNAGSASASEIVAGAIQDRDRGTLIGETTFGKGSVQQSHTLSDGSELRVTISRWYTPDDNSIDRMGITPDIIIETPEEFDEDVDAQLQRAIDFILSLD